MVWLLVALPLSAVVAAFWLLYAAAHSSGNDDLVPDRIQKTGEIQVSNLGPDSVAQRRNLSAVLRVEPQRVDVIPVTGDFDRNAPLRLSLRHPARAASDRTLVLKPDDAGWSAVGTIAKDNDWIVELAPSDNLWRIQGRLPREQQAARLAPNLAGQ
ncbi:MAG: FixH family protein [Luteimonas sp.]